MISEEMKEQLMAIGLTKQQVSNATADAVVNYLMNEDEKTLIQEAKNQVMAMQKQVMAMQGIIFDLRREYSLLKEKIDTVVGTLLDIAKSQEEYGAVTDEKAKNAIAMYGTIININERAGARGVDSVNNAGYVTYAYLGGQARRDIRYDQAQE